MENSEIKKIVGNDYFDGLNQEEKIKASIKFNEDIQKIQKKLGVGYGIPFGVYRFKNQEDADKQELHFTVLNSIKKRK